MACSIETISSRSSRAAFASNTKTRIPDQPDAGYAGILINLIIESDQGTSGLRNCTINIKGSR
jgi:hypothetical protein